MRHRISSSQLLILIIALLLNGCTPLIRPIPPTAQAELTLTPTAVAATTTTTGRLEGQVFRSDTDKPLANVTVELFDAAQGGNEAKQPVAETTTDAQGRYVLPVAPGVYSLVAVITAQSESAFPCTDPTGFGLVTTKAGWLAAIGTQKNTGLKLFLASEGQERPLAAGEVIKVDIDLACK